MCKYYRTAEIVLINGDGQVNQLALDVGDQVDFLVQDSRGQTYQMTSYVSAIPEMISTDKIRQSEVTVGTVTEAFLRDKASTVQSSHKNMPITTAAQMIHSMYIGTPLQIIEQSLGNIAQDQIGSHIVSGEKPATAIRNIIARANYASVNTGSTVYFENKFSHVIGPLEYFLTGSPIAAALVDRDTWGTDYRHMFGFDSAEGAILASKIYHKEGQASGAGDQAKTAAQSQTTIDQSKRFPVINDVKKVLNPKFLRFIGGNGGGKILTTITDAARNPLSTDPAIKALSEAAFKANVKDGTNWLIKTTIESGFKPMLTAGNRFSVTLRAPLTSQTGVYSGALLAADVMHECYFDNREVMGTTTLRGVKISG